MKEDCLLPPISSAANSHAITGATRPHTDIVLCAPIVVVSFLSLVARAMVRSWKTMPNIWRELLEENSLCVPRDSAFRHVRNASPNVGHRELLKTAAIGQFIALEHPWLFTEVAPLRSMTPLSLSESLHVLSFRLPRDRTIAKDFAEDSLKSYHYVPAEGVCRR